MKKFIFTFLLMLMPVIHVMANYYYTYVDGLYYDLKSDGTASVTSKFRYTDGSNEYSTNDYSGDVVIPSTVTYNNRTYKVTRIHDWAFWGCKGLKSVTIPGSIKYIGSEAFYFCSNYIINIEDIAAWCNIEMDDNSCLLYKNLYHNGEEIRDLVIPDNVTVIGKDAFRGCGSLTSVTIPNSVKSIKQYAFQGCKNLTSINIPTSMSLILAYTFAGCSSLKNVTIPNNISVIFAYAFSGCTSLTSITIPNSVTGMGGFVFENCSSLQSVTLSNNMTSIDEYEFWNCTSLTSISIPNSITSIKYGAFSGCSGLSSITIPKSVTSIGKYAFQNCTGLTTIKSEIEDPFEIDTNVFSSSDTDIYATATLIVPKGKKSAYNSTEGWKNFKYIVEEGEFVVDGIYYKVDENNTASVIKGNRTYSGDIVIPAYVNYDGKTYNVTSIDEYAFQYCGLASVTIPNSVTSIGNYAFYDCSGLTSVTIPNSVTSIGNNAFSDCKSLTSVTIGNSVTSIGNLAFCRCRSLTSITIPNSVNSIGKAVFFGCIGLTSVTIPNSVTFIGSHPLSNCSGLVSVKVESGNIKYDSRDDCNAIIEKSSNTLISGCKNTIIPNGVTTIGDYAFYGCDGLTSVSIPNSVTSIRVSAFGGCSGLTSVTIPNSVTFIIDGAFQKCSGLTSITVENSNLYYDSRNNCNAIIRKSTNTLIVGCKNTIIPNDVTTIGGWAFYDCDGLTSVSIPNSVTSIGYAAFYGCDGLTSVAIPNSVTSIGDSAFMLCSNLTSVIIPNSVTSIGGWAFYDCSSLTSILSFNNTPPKCDGTYDFYNFDKENCVLWVPIGCVAAYREASGWKDFQNIKEIVGGDVNLDEKVNRYDQNVLVAHIMGEKPEGFFDGLADLNGDDDVNAADVVTLVNILNNGGLSTEAEFGYDNVDGSLVVSSLTCTLNNERDEAILLTKCELYSNGSLLRSKSFSSNPVSVAAGGNKSCTFENLSKPANGTDFTVCWHYTVNGESFVYRCPLTD